MDLSEMLVMDKNYCWVCAEYARLVRAGRRDDGKRFVAQKLREEYSSKRFSSLVADLVDPDVKRPRGRPKGSHLNNDWHAIGHGFWDLRGGGVKHEDAADALADEYGVCTRTIETFAADHRKEMRQTFKIQKEWEREFAKWPRVEQDAYYREQLLAEAEEEFDPVFDEQCRAYLDEQVAEADRVLLACPHGCREGCRKATLLTGRRECALRTANK